MLYRNVKTDQVINVDSAITGGNWELISEASGAAAETAKVPEEAAKSPDTKAKNTAKVKEPAAPKKTARKTK